MKKVKVIPCLDVKEGRVVKGVKFVDLRDARDPAEVTIAYCREGADEPVFLDIAATVENRGTKLEWVALKRCLIWMWIRCPLILQRLGTSI